MRKNATAEVAARGGIAGDEQHGIGADPLPGAIIELQAGGIGQGPVFGRRDYQPRRMRRFAAEADKIGVVEAAVEPVVVDEMDVGFFDGSEGSRQRWTIACGQPELDGKVSDCFV